jgi:hypothetical protein
MAATTQETRNRAADIIGERGWRQGGWQDAEGRICAVSALFLAVDPNAELIEDESPWPAAVSKVHDEITLGLGVPSLSEWQDAPGRTEAEVLAALRGTRGR